MRLIVVGSGIVGASCAYAATSLGAEVVLVDAAKPGRATAAGAGIICPWSSRVADPAWCALAYAAAREYPALTARLADLGETDVGYRQGGALALAERAEDREQIRHTLLARRAAAPEIGEVTGLSGADAQRLFPPLRRTPPRCTSAARPGSTAASWRPRWPGPRSGRAPWSGAATRSWPSGGGGGRTPGAGGRGGGVRVGRRGKDRGQRGHRRHRRVDRALPDAAGLAIPVQAQRGQIMHISLGEVDTSRWPVVLPGASGHYLLAFGEGRIVAGATRETGSGLDYRVTPAGLAEILEQALAVAPGLADGTYLETRVGFRPMGPSIRPLLGPVPGLAGLVVATGLGASGLTMGPLAGSLAAQAALGLAPDIDLKPFAPLPGPSGSR